MEIVGKHGRAWKPERGPLIQLPGGSAAAITMVEGGCFIREENQEVHAAGAVHSSRRRQGPAAGAQSR